MTASEQTTRPKEVQHDETPSGITDHPFTPKTEWWSLCKTCNLSEAAHAETTVKFRYIGDNGMDDE